MVFIALDPYICLAASLGDDNSRELLNYIRKKQRLIRLCLDEVDQAILTAYEELLESPNLHPDERNWVNWVLTASEIHEELPTPAVESDWPLLVLKGCTTPVEPHLIALCDTPHQEIFVTIAGADSTLPLDCYRGIHDDSIVEDLRTLRFPNLDVYDSLHALRAIPSYLRTRSPYPSTAAELEAFLSKHDYRESDTLEFKQPDSKDTSGDLCLTQTILEEAMSEICALANTHGGKVIIGVAEHTKHIGTLEGFAPKYKKEKSARKTVKPKTEEEIKGILATHPKLLQKFAPPIMGTVRYTVIRLTSGRLAIVFHVPKPENQLQYTYGSKKFLRTGTSTIRVT